MSSIRHDALGIAICVLVYSGFCFIASLLLVCMLWRYGERASYVGLVSVFVTLSTASSIIQQIHHTVYWENVKEAEYQEAKLIENLPGLAFTVLGPVVDVVLFWLQFYCYDVLSLLIFFWTISLFRIIWGISFDWSTATEERISLASKSFAVLFPIVTVLTVNSRTAFRYPKLWLTVNYMIMVISLTFGSILLALILIKYIRTRRLTTRQLSSTWWQPDDISRIVEPETNLSLNSTATTYNRALIIRFSIAFCLLSAFEAVQIAFEIFTKRNNLLLATLPAPDYSLATAHADLIIFIPGVTASLVAFAVFGTTKSFSQYKHMLLLKPRVQPDHNCRRTMMRTEIPQRAPWLMLPSPVLLSPITMSLWNSSFPSPRNWGQQGIELSSLRISPANVSQSASKHLTIQLENPPHSKRNTNSPVQNTFND